MRNSDIAWLIGLLVFVAGSTALSWSDHPAKANRTPPEAHRPPQPPKLSIEGIGIGTERYAVELNYRVLKSTGDWGYYGTKWVDKTTGQTRYFLAVKYDFWGRAVVVKGPDLDSGLGPPVMPASPPLDLDHPDRVTQLGRRYTKGRFVSKVRSFDALGLDVVSVNGRPVEYILRKRR